MTVLRQPHTGFFGSGLFELTLAFSPNGGSPIVNASNRSSQSTGVKSGFTATRTGAGVVQIDLDEPLAELVWADVAIVGPTLSGGASGEYTGRLGAVNAAGTTGLANGGRRFTVTLTNAAGAATDLAAATDRFVCIRLLARISKGV